MTENFPERLKEIQRRILERETKLPIVEVSLDTSLEDIPIGPECIVCSEPTEKDYINNTRSRGKKLEVRAINVAGYRCQGDCGYESYGLQASLEFLTKARQVMLEKGDDSTAGSLAVSIENLRKTIEEERRDLPEIYEGLD